MNLALFSRKSRTHFYLLLIPAVCFFVYLAWACRLPLSEAPDEIIRLQVPFYIAANNVLPNGFDPSIRNGLWGISYAFTPYGSSLLSALFVKMAMMLQLNSALQVVAARLSSCISGAMTVLILILICRELEFESIVAALSGLMLGLLPQFAFLSSYLNNDIFSALCTALVILGWLRGLRGGWLAKDCVFLGVGIGLLSLSYYFAYGLIPISIVLFFVGARRRGLEYEVIFRRAALVFAVAFLIGGWFFVRNAIIYSGDFLGMRSYSESAELYAIDDLKPSAHMTPKLAGEQFMSPLFGTGWLLMTNKSCICYLGGTAYPLNNVVYGAATILYAVTLLAAVVLGKCRLLA